MSHVTCLDGCKIEKYVEKRCNIIKENRKRDTHTGDFGVRDVNKVNNVRLLFRGVPLCTLFL